MKYLQLICVILLIGSILVHNFIYHLNQQKQQPPTCEEKSYELVELCMDQSKYDSNPSKCLQQTDMLMLHCHTSHRNEFEPTLADLDG